MLDFHADKSRYFRMQMEVTSTYIIPFITKNTPKATSKPRRILEIGCAEAGVLMAFLEHGDEVVGIELSSERFATATLNLSDYIQAGKAKLINSNVYDIDPKADFEELFDIIILKDVIEHIPDQERFIPILKTFLKPEGLIFFAYPPWSMPFGGHQQICNNRVLRSLPWFHLLPSFLYTKLLEACGESKGTVKELLEIKATGINIGRLKSILKINNYPILAEIYWAINPIYQYKFGAKPLALPSLFGKIPFLRNLYTTAHYVMF